jgi:antitoxin FitA
LATNLVVRNVDEYAALALELQAASHGRSAEAEHWRILRALRQRPKRRSLAEVLARMPPMALSHGIGAETQKPLAVVVIGWLNYATLLTLLVSPTPYLAFHRERAPTVRGHRQEQ